jgi:hypothetical protein
MAILSQPIENQECAVRVLSGKVPICLGRFALYLARNRRKKIFSRA